MKGENVITPIDGHPIFPGGHPYNLAFLFFVEHGVFGLLFLLSIIYSLFKYICREANTYSGVEYVIPLIMAYQVIHLFSFAIWQADIVILLTFFFILVRIVMRPVARLKNTDILG